MSDDSPSPATPPPRRRRSVPLLAGGLAVIVALVVGAVVWQQQRPADPGGDPVETGSPTATSSGTPWDERPPSEQSTATAPTSDPTNTAAGLVACKKSSRFNGEPTKQKDGWLTSGSLSVKSMGGDWLSSTIELPSAYDNASEIMFIYPNWTSTSTVARLAKDDGFTDPQSAAGYMMDCVARSGYYAGFKSREDLGSEAMTVDGHPAWHLSANVYAEDPNAPEAKGDLVDVVVVDLNEQSLGVYVSGCTIGDKEVCDQVHKTITTLKVSG